MVDFEGRPADLGFIIDSFDMAISFCTVLIVLIKVILELKLNRRITKITALDISLTLVCLGGMIYEAKIASDFANFLQAETLAVDLLRTCKCLRLLLLFLERKHYWKKLHDFIMVIADSLKRMLWTFCLWFCIILSFAIMGHHI